jgi:hypothetical protein
MAAVTSISQLDRQHHQNGGSKLNGNNTNTHLSTGTLTGHANDEEWSLIEWHHLLDELSRLNYHRQIDRHRSAASHSSTSNTPTLTSPSISTSSTAPSTTAVHVHGNDELEQRKRSLREQWRNEHEDRVMTRLQQWHSHHTIPRRQLQEDHPTILFNDSLMSSTHDPHDTSVASTTFNVALRHKACYPTCPPLVVLSKLNPCAIATSRHS